jgi:hypothetical protein
MKVGNQVEGIAMVKRFGEAFHNPGAARSIIERVLVRGNDEEYEEIIRGDHPLLRPGKGSTCAD